MFTDERKAEKRPKHPLHVGASYGMMGELRHSGMRCEREETEEPGEDRKGLRNSSTKGEENEQQREDFLRINFLF